MMNREKERKKKKRKIYNSKIQKEARKRAFGEEKKIRKENQANKRNKHSI